MKQFILLALYLLGSSVKAQISGVTTYSFNQGNNVYSSLRQQMTQTAAGDIFVYDPNALALVKFSAGTFTSYAVPFLSGFPLTNVAAVGNGVWIYNELNELVHFNGTSFTNHINAVNSLIGTITNTNPINYIGSDGTNAMIATNQGIVKFDGTNFSLINKSNSSLTCDTVNCIINNGNTTYVGTFKGLSTLNGTVFTQPIQFSGASSHAVNHIFSNGVRTIVSRSGNTGNFNYYELQNNQLIKIPGFADSMSYVGARTMCFVNNNPVFTTNGMFRIASSSQSFTTYPMPQAGSGSRFIFYYPGNPQKLLFAGTNTITKVNEVDLTTYSNYGYTFNNDQYKYLDTNQVKALIGYSSLKHWDMFGSGNARYEVPKGGGTHTIFGTTLWMGALDNSNLLHLSAETYRQSGMDYWPGPLDTITGVANPVTGAAYNQIWKFSCNQINQFVANFNAANLAANSSPAFADINSYKPVGNSMNNFAKKLAPFKDWNNNNVYEPQLGEYPVIKGHQQIYSVFNDNYKPHSESGFALPLGFEVHEKSYAYNFPALADSMQVINYTSFYNYEVYNRSNNNYNNVYLTMWVDADLGYFLDDYIGTDSLNNFAYVYNSDSYDETGAGVGGYGQKLPMMAYALLPQSSAQSDGIDNNNNGIIDEANENFRLNLTTYYNNNVGAFPPATTNPDTKWQFYNYMSGRWKDSTQFRYGGSSYNPTLTVNPTSHVFTGNPQTASGWTEATAGNLPGDRRLLCTIGPFNFPANKKVEFEYAFVFSRDTTLNNVNNNFSLLQKDVKNVRYFSAQQNTAACTPVAYVGVKEYEKLKLNVWAYPNPTQSMLIINLDHNAANANITVYNIMGQAVVESSIENSYAGKINVEKLAAGIYFVEVSENNLKSTVRIIKQ